MPSHQTILPAEWVIRQFGGVRKTAAAIGRDPGSISEWRTSKERKGTDGRVPSKAQGLVLAAAGRLGLDITAADLVQGRRVRI